jgi:hypothetical protein
MITISKVLDSAGNKALYDKEKRNYKYCKILSLSLISSFDKGFASEVAVHVKSILCRQTKALRALVSELSVTHCLGLKGSRQRIWGDMAHIQGMLFGRILCRQGNQ